VQHIAVCCLTGSPIPPVGMRVRLVTHKHVLNTPHKTFIFSGDLSPGWAVDAPFTPEALSNGSKALPC